MENSRFDLSVLIIFFARPNTLKEVFARVKAARPARLFLACDGPREGVLGERERVDECKKIVSDIDWECEVHTRYSEENLGCGKGPATAISWAFEHTDKLVILEDDCVPADSFFPYMEEMLNRYENDSRVGVISGFNHFCEWPCGGNSYCFTKYGATLGWGTFKRVWQQFDFHVDAVKNEYYRSLLEKDIPCKKSMRCRLGGWQHAANETRVRKVNYWDVQFGFLKYAQSYLSVVPKYNLIYNIGVGVGSTHTAANKQTEWKLGRVLFMPTRDLEFPLVHPECVICDRNYDEQCFRKVWHKSKFKKALNKIKRTLCK